MKEKKEIIFFNMLRKKRNLTDITALETEQGIIEED
jgi:hypothetical protein